MRIDLKAERLNRGLSLREAGRKIGVHDNTLRRAESGDGVHPRHALKIADFYGYRVTDVWPLPDEDNEPQGAAA